MPISKLEPDKRWRGRAEMVDECVDALERELHALAELDAEHPDATWSEYVEHARGCMEGIKFLLLQAGHARTQHILGRWPIPGVVREKSFDPDDWAVVEAMKLKEAGKAFNFVGKFDAAGHLVDVEVVAKEKAVAGRQP